MDSSGLVTHLTFFAGAVLYVDPAIEATFFGFFFAFFAWATVPPAFTGWTVVTL